MNILIIGGISIDTLIYTPEIKELSSDMSLFASRTTKQIGGTGAGKALMMSKFKANTTTLVCQAAEEDHAFIKDTFVSRGINPIILKSNKTEQHTNIMHGNDHRLSIFTAFSDISNDINEVVSDQMLEEADIIFLNINGFCIPLIPRLKAYKDKIVVDLHDYQIGSDYHNVFLSVGAFLFTSCVNLKDQTSFLQDSIIDYKLEVSVITCNKAGATGLTKEGYLCHSEALKNINVIDSNGAGDGFIVGFMLDYVKHKKLDQALLFGNVCGAFACESQELIDERITEFDIYERYNKLS